MTYDVIIVGGGPAGLSAALVLGRCRRRVLVCDAATPRNAAAQAVHCFLTRDGTPPARLLRKAREEARGYGVRLLSARVVSARRDCSPNPPPDPFEVTVESGKVYRARKLLLATGVVDVLPDVEGARDFYGRGVHHCPYCDGYEYRGKRLAAFGDGKAAAGLALSLRTWSGKVTACTNGADLSGEDTEQLARNGIALRTERVVRLEGEDVLRRVVFASGPALGCDALFFNTDKVQQSDLAAQLDCPRTEWGQPRSTRKQRTDVPGLFLAGDADGEVQFAIVAAAEGATAAVVINSELQAEDRA
jgi:thioredoxin reductase